MKTTKSQRKADVITLMDVAIHANVSAKTASLALRGHPSVSKETTKRVQEVAINLGYKPRREEKRAIGILVPFLNHIPYIEVIGFMREWIFSYDVITLVGETTGDPDIERRLISEFSRRGVDGLILISPRIPKNEIETISRTRQPIVCVNVVVGEDSHFSFGSVEIDNEFGAYTAVKYLIEQGHRRIAFLAGRFPSSSAQQRRRGFVMALENAGLKQHERMIVEIGTYKPTFQAGYEQCQRILSKGEPYPDAIVAYNDLMAIGAIKALYEPLNRQIIKVPDDISVVGFDNTNLAQFTLPPLTTSGVQADRIAWQVVDTLFNMLNKTNNNNVKLHHKLIPELVIRESVKNRL